ncbi:translation initiation factor IF-2-like [Macaca thibetana thibetana]|uniref:translation initiation factor IF-2-like n=1 Tax=Macaca thibetana thibetana TaxID=257877 RepID=UPI0021BCFAD5|nr:translation initiation factor IF-2-like [Macaca thibetana thibetana]
MALNSGRRKEATLQKGVRTALEHSQERSLGGRPEWLRGPGGPGGPRSPAGQPLQPAGSDSRSSANTALGATPTSTRGHLPSLPPPDLQDRIYPGRPPARVSAPSRLGLSPPCTEMAAAGSLLPQPVAASSGPGWPRPPCVSRGTHCAVPVPPVLS